MRSVLVQKAIDKVRGKKPIQNKDYEFYCKGDVFTSDKEFVEVKKNSFYDVYMNHDEFPSGKWEQYLHIYDKHFKQFVEENKPINILEIGICEGGSLQIWSKFFPANSKITGIDINPDCAKIPFKNDNIEVFIGSASDKDFIEKNFNDRNFDIIIDDGSHLSHDVITTFEEFFPKLNPGGLYVVEDMHTSYWASYGGGYRQKASSIEYFKQILDSLNYRYIEDFNYERSIEKIEKLKVYNQQIASMTFYDSLLIIEKYTHPRTRGFKLYTNGKKNDVNDDTSVGITCTSNTKFEKFFR